MLALALVLANAAPITKIGSTCPYGYHSSFGYCVPNPLPKETPRSIPRTQTYCPFGTYKTGNYCTWTPGTSD